MVPSEVHLTVLIHVVTTTELKSVSIGLSRFETWPRQGFSIGTHLDIHSWIISSKVHLTGLSHVVTTTDSKSVSLGVGSKPAANIFTVCFDDPASSGLRVADMI
jgi:hypothetical protein